MDNKDFQSQLISLENRLYYFALSLTSNSNNAEDLTQETMLKALIYQNKFKENTNLKAWLYTIMKNTFINDYRKGIKAKNTFDKNNVDYHLSISKDISGYTPEGVQIQKDIYDSINRLDREFRKPFVMFIEGYKYKEIAEILHLPLGTVKSRIFFTRKKLEKFLVDYAA